MDDVDRMIVDHLVNDLHCSFADKVSRLDDFDSTHLVEGIVRCIWRCRPDSIATFPTYQLPNNPIERFRLASKISYEIQAVGLRDQQIGYQTLLYPNVFDSRHIFLALFEHFPKESVRSSTEKTLSPIEKIRTDVGAIIADHLKTKWTPEFCRFYELQRIGRLWFPSSTNGRRNQTIFGDDKMEEQQGDGWTTNNSSCIMEQQQKIQILKTAPKIAPKPKLATKLSHSLPAPALSSTSSIEEIVPTNVAAAVLTTATTTPIPVAQSSQNDGEPKLQNVHQKVSQKRFLLAQRRRMLAELHRANFLLAEQIKMRQNVIGMDERLVQLLDEPEENRQKLEHYIGCADNRKCAIEQKFVEAERERLSQLDYALDGRRTMTEAAGKNGAKAVTQQSLANDAAKLADLVGTIGTLEQLLEQRQRIRQKFLRECKKMGEISVENAGGGVCDGRAKYVQRILEMSAMVGKQNDEIRRTAKSVQNLRKEIAQLMGSLERTFIAVDRWLSKNAEDNARMQRAYKLMVRTHEQCSLVMTCIEEHGQLSRHADELIDKISVEQQKSVDEQLEKLLDDLMLINHENTELEKRISNCSFKPNFE